MELRYKALDITNQQINQYRDFDALLQQYYSQPKPKPGKLGKGLFIAGVVFLTCSIGLWYLYPKSSNSQSDKLDFNEQASPTMNAPLPKPPQPVLMPEPYPAPVPPSEKAPSNTSARDKPAPTTPPEEQTTTNEPATSSSTFAYSEAEPELGYPHLYRYLSDKLQYPAEALEKEIEGTVVISFSINKAGRPVGLSIVEGLQADLDQEARRLILSMPNWKPATINGEIVNSRKTLPITFKIKK